MVVPRRLFHFSEDPTIKRFEPHVPATNPTQTAAVWAIDERHAPLYWFPRDCPRVTAWPRTDVEQRAFVEQLCCDAGRLHAVEFGWFDRMRSTTLYRYEFDPATFAPWADASGQWISRSSVEPRSIVAMADPLQLHADAEIELRLLDDLWPLVDRVMAGPWDFSLVRLANATPRKAQG